MNGNLEEFLATKTFTLPGGKNITAQELLNADLSAPRMKVSDDEMALNQIALHARDCCAHWLIEMKRCQRKEYFLPWKCHEETHSYEACLIQDSIRRHKIKLREKLLEDYPEINNTKP